MNNANSNTIIKEFNGNLNTFRESIYFASEDIEHKDEVELKINSIEEHRNVTFDGGRKKERVLAIGFENQNKKLVLNSTNRKKLMAHYGNKVSEWKGKKISIYIDNKVRLMGKLTRGIRIK